MGVPKIPAKIFIFEEILKGTFQLSVKHSIFHLEFMSVCVAALLLFKPCSSYYSGFGMLPGQKHIHFNCFLTRTKSQLDEYGYFFGVYHNNETD